MNAGPILITGANGQVGTELRRLDWDPRFEAVGLNRAELDLTDFRSIREMVAQGHHGTPWMGVINAGAYTAVDAAENDQVTAWQVNALAPAAFAEACRAAGIPLIQVSTDYVFSGDGNAPRQIDDPVCPINIYGASKLGGEIAVRASGARHAIVRTAWVVSPHGRNFAKTMLSLAKDRDTLSVVNDQIGCPTSAADLAGVLAQLMTNLIHDPASPAGTYHFSNAGQTTWAEFAEEIFRQSSARGGAAAKVVRVKSDSFPTPAKRPANSVLDHGRLSRDFGIFPRAWQDALGDILDELIGAIK